METRTGVVVILYRSVERNYETLIGHPGIEVILVDNTPARDLGIGGGNVHYIPLKENRGIATAQNIGIGKARELGCVYVALFDQDSVIAPDYVDRMREEYKRLKTFYPTLAVLGPTVVNRDSGQEYKAADTAVEHDCRVVSVLISSGSFYETATLDEVGMMEDRLFIDCVDFEWCWRVAHKGRVCAVTQRVALEHKVGQSDHVFMGYPVILSAPVRYYYQYRNYLWLVRRNYVPLKWKISTGIRKAAEMVLLPFYAKDRRALIGNIFRGIKDGIFCNNKV